MVSLNRARAELKLREKFLNNALESKPSVTRYTKLSRNCVCLRVNIRTQSTKFLTIAKAFLYSKAEKIFAFLHHDSFAAICRQNE